MINKRFSVLSSVRLALMSFACFSQSINNLALAKQCYLLHSRVNELAMKQPMNGKCSFLLVHAMFETRDASFYIIEEEYLEARTALQESLDYLKMAEAIPCDGLADMVIIKNKLTQINDQISKP